MRLTQREKLLAAGMIIFAAGWTLYTFVVRPATERIATLNRVIPEKQAQLQQLRTKSREYITLRNKVAELRAQIGSSGSGELGRLETLINRSGLEDKVVQIRRRIAGPDIAPAGKVGWREAIVEIKLAGITLAQLVNLLEQIETSQAPATVQTLYIRKNTANAELLDSVVEIHKAEPTRKTAGA